MGSCLCYDKGQRTNVVRDPLLPEGDGDGGGSRPTSTASLVSEVKDDHIGSSLEIADNQGPQAVEEETAHTAAEFHPLLNEDILKYVLSYIVEQSGSLRMSQDVRNIRLVSCLWKDVATQLYRRSPRRTEISFGSWNDDWGGDRMIARLESFIETMKTATMIPVQRFGFAIRGSQFYSEQARGNVMKEFIQLCGTDAVSLTFFSHTRTEVALNPEWCLPKTLDLPKLKTLVVVYICSPDWTSDPWHPVTIGFAEFIGFLLRAARNLREFRFIFATTRREDDPRVMTIGKHFAEIISGELPSTVQNLSLGMDLPDVMLLDLTKMGLRLEEFHAATFPASEIGKDFLKSQEETLQSLHIQRWRHSGGIIDTEYLSDLERLPLPWLKLKANRRLMELLKRNLVPR